MDKRLIDIGRSRIALNMIGFGLIYGIGHILIFRLAGGAGIQTPGTWGPWDAIVSLVIVSFFLLAILYVFGRCLGGIVHGIAEIVRGVNTNRPMPPPVDPQ
ncbi:MAG: hypothetical protein ABIP75_08255 [Pyrinomonadaceae bacterium]